MFKATVCMHNDVSTLETNRRISLTEEFDSAEKVKNALELKQDY